MAEAHSQTLSSSNLTEFCEQVNPRVLLEMRRARPFPEMQRVQESWVAAAEKRALLWLAARLPEWIGPDHLTALGLTAQIAASAGYALARTHRLALLGVIACLALNWFGDSLDGTLARVRQKLRRRYGFYVDHMVDSLARWRLWVVWRCPDTCTRRLRLVCSSRFSCSPFSRILRPMRLASFACRSGNLAPPSCASCWR